MKKVIVLLTALCSSLSVLQAQNNVGINTTTPHSSAALDIAGTDKGLLIPRMTLAQRNVIASPANGLMVYQTDNTPGFYYFTGSGWTSLGSANGELQKIIESGKTGYRLLGKDSNNYGSIGNNAIDLSHSASASTTRGATGNHAVALGTETEAKSFSETTVGMFNSTYTPISTTAHHKGDRAFTVGVGSADSNRRDGLIVYKDGSLGLYPFTSTDFPYFYDNKLYAYEGRLHFDGYPVDQSPFVASGFLGVRRKLHEGSSLFATTGDYAVDLSSITGGNNNVGASGGFSFAANQNAKAQGYASASLGQNTMAQTRCELSVGAFNDTIPSPQTFTWSGADRIFQVGTGQSNTNRSSSFIVYKNGRVLIAPANGVANNPHNGITSYVGWQGISNWNINDPASLEVAPATNSTNSTLKVFGRSANTNITVLKDSAIAGKKFMSFRAGIGVGEIGSVTIGPTGSSTLYNTTSDKRLKIDKGLYRKGLSTINHIKIHDYVWKLGGDDVGVFAQELYETYPNAVSKGDELEVENVNDIEQRWQVDYSKLVPVLVAATQELSQQNDALKKENDKLKEQMTAFHARLEKIEHHQATQEANIETASLPSVSTK
jgi:hypothetical protein